MNLARAFIAPLIASIVLAPAAFGAAEVDFKKIAPKVEKNVGELLEKAHYGRIRLDDALSKRLLKNYLERLDYNHLFFTQKDVDSYSAAYATTLDDDIMAGNTEPAMTIYSDYRRHVENRVVKVKKQLEGKFEFKGLRTVEVNRQKSPWPKDDAEADQIWKDRVEGEMLDRVLLADKVDAPAKVLNRRYDQLLRNLHDQSDEDVISNFLSVLAETYDPHSEYMSRTQLDGFNITMSLQLVGIGAVLTSDEGYTKIRELVPGGPADQDGRIKVGDRISAVSQGDANFVETLDMKLDKVVEMVRGKEDTAVRLRVIPVNATDPSERKVIEIVRKKVKLKESEAKAEIVEQPLPNGTTQRLGWIVLPSFYADMQHSGTAGAKSTTKDVLALIERLKKENIQGLVMDLRRNGGGSLEEAVNLTGLFIKSGPVVMARDSVGKAKELRDRDTSVAYDGPMVVLANKLSASASEIFAAALQDYNRAVVVGDSSTFGKGTVQTIIPLENMMPLSLSGRENENAAGALKLTIQKFYRISGGSTQLQGVVSDVKLPSPWDQTDIGEGSLKGPMPYDTIPAAKYEPVEKPLYKEQLKQRALARIAKEQEFRWIQEDAERSKELIAENKVSLNEQKRRTELDENKARKETRNAERAKLKPPEEKVFSVTLDNLSKPELELKKDKPKAVATHKAGEPLVNQAAEIAKELPKTKTDANDDDDDDDAAAEVSRRDPIRNETLHILTDLIEFGHKAPPALPATAATIKGAGADKN